MYVDPVHPLAMDQYIIPGNRGPPLHKVDFHAVLSLYQWNLEEDYCDLKERKKILYMRCSQIETIYN